MVTSHDGSFRPGLRSYLTLLRSAPAQLQATMAAVIEATRRARGAPIGTGEAYDAYTGFCDRAGLRTLTDRAFGCDARTGPVGLERRTLTM